MGTALTKIQEFQGNLSKLDFKAMLPDHIKPEKFISIVMTAIRRKPDLLNLNRASLYVACEDCAKDGLIPDGREAAFVPSKGGVRYTPMVAGITKKARNSGEIATIDSIVVCEKDEYDSWIDEKGQHFRHKKARGDRGKDILTYAYAITKDGGFYFEEIDEEQMDAIEKCCTAKNSPWKGPFRPEMKRKSALHRLCKYRLPSSSDMDGVIHRDDSMYDLDNSESEVENAEEKEPVKSKLEKAVESKDEVVDAEFEEAKSESDQPQEIQKWTKIGKIQQLTEKKGETNSKKWTKYGCKIDDTWYGTFSSTHQKNMLEAKEKDSNVEIIFEQAEKPDGKKLNNIVSFKEIWEEEADVVVPEEDIAI